MALVVEDGTMVTGSESYGTVAEFIAYANKRGYTTVADNDLDVNEVALRKAASYLDGHYRMRWKGRKVNPVVQSMEWPRYGVKVADFLATDAYQIIQNPELYGYIGTTTIPQRLKEAQFELAYRALSGDLATDTDISIKREKVDILETEYATGVMRGKISYPMVDQLLSDFLESSMNISLSRS
jgi:hypothetical protein